MRRRQLWAAGALVGAALLGAALLIRLRSAAAQAAPATEAMIVSPALDSVLGDARSQEYVGRSRHFVLYARRGDPQARALAAGLIDSLEAAWTHDVAMLGAARIDDAPIDVVVTSAQAGPHALLRPDDKGLTTQTLRGDLIILVHNDSVRAYTRHEVMHVVSLRAWGRAVGSAYWLVEGLATLADGRCQGTTVAATARDLLRGDPRITAHDATDGFLELVRRDRAKAYVLAGSYAGFLWESHGRDGVRRVWRGLDSAATPEQRVSAGGFTLVEDPTTAWRAYLEREAGSRLGLSRAAFRRAGCG